MEKISISRCCAIVVAYNPDIKHIQIMVDEILKLNLRVIIYDNSPRPGFLNDISESISELFSSNIRVLVFGDGINHGLSFAYNKSINIAYNLYGNIEGFIFFDQDSYVTSKKLEQLIFDYQELIYQNIPVGIIGATPIDLNGMPYIPSSCSQCGFNLPVGFSSHSFVISSFSFVPSVTIKKIGLFDDRLFIDLVDSEYSFRCQKFGLLNIMTANVQFVHVVGTNRIKLLVRTLSVSNPLRNYYQTRNLILVGISYKWRLKLFIKLTKRFLAIFISGVCCGNFLKRISYFIKGVLDGFHGKSGAFKND